MGLRRHLARNASCPNGAAGHGRLHPGLRRRARQKAIPDRASRHQGQSRRRLSPNEWEAIGAANSVAATTKWTEWAGLPGSDNLNQSHSRLQMGAPSQNKGNPAEVNAALQGAHKTISATYELPYVRHATDRALPCVADVRSDGSVIVWTHSAQFTRPARADREYAEHIHR